MSTERAASAGRSVPGRLISSLSHLAWPAFLAGPEAHLIALQHELGESEWWSPDKIRWEQMRQLTRLVAHARSQVPFYRDRLDDAGINPANGLTDESWQEIPILTRRQVQELGNALNASEVPKEFGEISEAASGGSSGVPVRVRKTKVDHLFWTAIHVREELWHRDGSRGVLARIRRVPGELNAEQAARVRSVRGLMLPNWGPPVARLWRTGPLGVLDDRVSIPAQVAFLERLQPEYLDVFPANLRLLLAHYRERGASLRSIRSVWTMSEVVDASLRDTCREIFGARIIHNYSAAETGYLALQCPEREDSFHVQSESVLLEVLDGRDRPCAPGEVGRVVVTPLHNFATPLLRYEIGDEAEVGAPCGCGRGLTVLRRIVGRTNDYITTRSGRRQRVDSGYSQLCKIRAIREFQIVQRTLGHVELLVVLAHPLTPAETNEIRHALRESFSSELKFTIAPCDAIARTEGGKLRTFVSEVAPPQ